MLVYIVAASASAAAAVRQRLALKLSLVAAAERKIQKDDERERERSRAHKAEAVDPLARCGGRWCDTPIRFLSARRRPCSCPPVWEPVRHEAVIKPRPDSYLARASELAKGQGFDKLSSSVIMRYRSVSGCYVRSLVTRARLLYGWKKECKNCDQLHCAETGARNQRAGPRMTNAISALASGLWRCGALAEEETHGLTEGHTRFIRRERRNKRVAARADMQRRERMGKKLNLRYCVII